MLFILFALLGEQGWRIGESARLPPMCPGPVRIRRHIWVEFVVGSRPCTVGFSPGSPVFLLPQNINISKFQFDREFEGQDCQSHTTVMCYPRYTKSIYFYFILVLSMSNLKLHKT